MEKEIINAIWLCIAKNQKVLLENIYKDVFLNNEYILKTLKLLLNKKIILQDENGFYNLPKEYDVEMLFNAIVLNIDSNFIEEYVKINDETRDLVIKRILTKQKEENKKIEKKHLKNKKIEKIKSQNWLLILNDIKSICHLYKDVTNKKEELNIILNIKKEFENKFKSYFK